MTASSSSRDVIRLLQWSRARSRLLRALMIAGVFRAPSRYESIWIVLRVLNRKCGLIWEFRACNSDCRRALSVFACFACADPNFRKQLLIALKPGVISHYEREYTDLMERVANGIATPDEREHFHSWLQPLIDYILQAPAEELFDYREIPYVPFDPGFAFDLFVCGACKEEAPQSTRSSRT